MLTDQLSHLSKFRTINPVLKIVFSLSSLLCCMILRSNSLCIFIFFLLSTLSVHGGISLSLYIKLLRVPAAFLIMAAAAVVFTFSAKPLSLFALRFGVVYLTMDRASFLYGTQLFLLSFSCISCLYFLSLSTPMHDLFYAFKKMRCPYLIIELMLLIYRFVGILMELLNNLHTASDARLGNKNFKTLCKSSGNIMSVLFIRAFRKSSALYDSMESRGHTGILPYLEVQYPIHKKEVFGLIIYITLISAAGYFLP